MRTKINCSRIDCKYCGDSCICQRNEISFSYHSVFTVNNGRQEYLKCKGYVEDDDDRFNKAAKDFNEYMDLKMRKEKKNESI